MKKRTGIFLLACLSLPVLGTYTWLHVQKMRVKQEVKHAILAGLGKERTIRMAFTQAEAKALLHWEHASEFEFQDQMYDVLEQAVQGDSIIYWCWRDQEETLLNRYLETLAINAFAGDPEHQEAQDDLRQFFETLYYQTQSEWCLFKPIPLDELASSLQGAAETWFHSWKQRPPSPPPKMV